MRRPSLVSTNHANGIILVSSSLIISELWLNRFATTRRSKKFPDFSRTTAKSWSLARSRSNKPKSTSGPEICWSFYLFSSIPHASIALNPYSPHRWCCEDFLWFLSFSSPVLCHKTMPTLWERERECTLWGKRERKRDRKSERKRASFASFPFIQQDLLLIIICH